MQGETGVNQFRILAVSLSILLFCAGIVVTLGIFLPITGYVPAESLLFGMGQRVFSVYGFSAFLIPLLFLYGTVLLLIPGWSREAKAVFLGVPLYFTTVIIGERLINIFAPSVSIPVVRHFVVVSIIICVLLLVCFEIFLMLTLSEKLAGVRFFTKKGSAADVLSETYVSEEPDATAAVQGTEDAAAVSTEIVSDSLVNAASPDGVAIEQAGISASDDETVVEQTGIFASDNGAAIAQTGVSVSDDETAVEQAGISASDHETAVAQAETPFTAADCVSSSDITASYSSAGNNLSEEALYTEEELCAVSDAAPFSDSFEEHGSADAVEADAEATVREIPVQPPVVASESYADESASGTQYETITPTVAENDALSGSEQPAAVQEVAEEEEAVLEAELVDLESVSPEAVSGTEDVPQSAPLSEGVTLSEQAEPDIRLVFDPNDPNNLFASLEEITAPIERIKQGNYIRPLPVDGEDLCSAEGSCNEEGRCSAKDTRSEEGTHNKKDFCNENALTIEEAEYLEGSAAEECSDAPLPNMEEENRTADIALANDSLAEDSLEQEYEKTGDAQSSAPLDAEYEACAAEYQEGDVEYEDAVDEHWEPVMPLVFTNGVPIPNERSDLLDTLVVIDSEPQAAFEPVRQERSVAAHSIPEAAAPLANGAKDSVPLQSEIMPSTADMTDSEAERAYETDYETDYETEREAEISAQVDEACEQSEAAAEQTLAAAVMEDDASFLNTIEQPVVVPCTPAVPQAPRKKYAIPFDLLTHYPDGEYWIVDDATRRSALMLKSTFNEFKIDVSIIGIRKGPVVTMFEMLPSPGIKLSKITNLQDNIALRLAASSVRIVAPIPGKHAVGIEVPNKKRSIVSFRELIETDLPEAAKMAIPIVLGKDVTGNPQLLDLAQTPHLLIAGATGSGKSVCVNSIILSILYNRRPDEVKLILVDPKIVELKLYNDIAHLLTPVITEPKRAFQALQYALCEMERRYALLDNMGVRDIKTFNAKIKSERIATEPLPYIVIIIDEFADLMATSGKELEATVARLCAMSRAVGIHLVLATQRPSIDVITGLIKANIPSRIAFMVASKTDSRIILDEMGAEKLLGKGDMLYVSAARPFPTRMQGAFVSEQEVERVVACVKEYCEPEYIDDEIFVDDDDENLDSAVFSDDNDPLYDQALEIVTFAGKASASYVQRKLKIGYNRAARLIEEMEARGIVGPANGSKAREIIRHG